MAYASAETSAIEMHGQAAARDFLGRILLGSSNCHLSSR